MKLFNKLLQLGLLLSVICAEPIQDIIQKYDDGYPMIIYIYEDEENIIRLKEKRFYYQNGQIKAIGEITGFQLGSWNNYDENWEYFDETGKILQDPIALNTINKTDKIYQELDDNQKVILKKIESIEKSIANLALASKNIPAADNKKQPPQADPIKVYNIEIGDSFTLGPNNAKVTIIEWADFQ